jgi:hypothetical protein
VDFIKFREILAKFIISPTPSPGPSSKLGGGKVLGKTGDRFGINPRLPLFFQCIMNIVLGEDH